MTRKTTPKKAPATLFAKLDRLAKILGGIPVFVGTRVPLQSLIDYLSAGDRLDDFLHSFPSVRREQAIAALTEAAEALERALRVGGVPARR